MQKCAICSNSLPIPETLNRSPTIAHARDEVLPAHGSLCRDRRVWMNSPCPRRTNMKALEEIGNRSFGRFLEPKKFASSLVSLVSKRTDRTDPAAADACSSLSSQPCGRKEGPAQHSLGDQLRLAINLKTSSMAAQKSICTSQKAQAAD